MGITGKLGARSRGLGHHIEGLDQDERFVVRTCCAYLYRVLARYENLDYQALSLFNWLVGNQQDRIATLLLSKFRGEHQQAVALALAQAQEDEEEFTAQVARCLMRYPRQVKRAMLRFALQALKDRHASLAQTPKCNLERNLARMGKMLGLNQTEQGLCLFLYLMGAWGPVTEYFDSHLCCDRPAGRKYLLAALSMDHQELSAALQGRLKALGVLEACVPILRMEFEFMPFLTDSPEGGLASRLFKKVEGPALPLESFFWIDKEVTNHLLELLRGKPSSATNVLFYGNPGTGKTAFAHALVSRLKTPAYQIVRNPDSDPKAQRGAIEAALNLTNNGSKGSIIVVDEADALLNTVKPLFLLGQDAQDKSWLNQVLEVPGTRMIWLVNHVDGMEQSVRRRFAFSLCFKPFGRAQREQVWRSVLKQRGIADKMAPADVQALAQEFKVSAGAVDLAVQKALEGGERAHGGFQATVRRALTAHLALNHGGHRPVAKDEVPEGYMVEVLNADVDLKNLLAQAQAFDRQCRKGGAGPGNFNVLLHGVSGSGKSAFTRYLAHQLDREVLARRGSDILGPFVGQSERNLAKAFEEAEREEAVLVIDEVDSLLGARANARCSWEVSLVNEFLASMERFHGIMLATTNRLPDLDPASIRRFTWKARFGHLRGEACIALYQATLAPLVEQPVGPEEMATLGGLMGLTPGDFAVVRDRLALYGIQTPTHSQCLEALSAELKVREKVSQPVEVGFIKGVG